MIYRYAIAESAIGPALQAVIWQVEQRASSVYAKALCIVKKTLGQLGSGAYVTTGERLLWEAEEGGSTFMEQHLILRRRTPVPAFVSAETY